MSGMTLTPDHLLQELLRLAPAAGGYWVAYSGGLDSHVLLQLLASRRELLPAPLGAIHVNHNLQASAPAWAAHCADVCRALELECRVLSVTAAADRGESPEAAARAARYCALTEALPAGHVLLTAHHQDDQAETLLLQLLRGAGPKGLAAMPASTELGAGTLVRPLLGIARQTLLAYAREQKLRWIEDPSNAQPGFDRNYLRHTVLPRLLERWPATAAVLARSATHQAEAAQLLDALAALDLREHQGRTSARHELREETSDPTPSVLANTSREAVTDVPLSVSKLLALSAPRRANLLRYWLHCRRAPVPSTAVLARIEADLLRAAIDAEPQVHWGNVCLRRYRDALYLTAADGFDGGQRRDWRPAQPLDIAGGVLRAEAGLGQGVASRLIAEHALQVRFRQGGERLQPAGRREHHQLKHLFQEIGVPPWERARVPLIYLDGTLIAVAGYWVCEGFQAAEQEPGMRFLWSRAIVPDRPIW